MAASVGSSPTGVAIPAATLASSASVFTGSAVPNSLTAPLDDAELAGDLSLTPVVPGTMVAAKPKPTLITALVTRGHYFRKPVASKARIANRVNIADRNHPDQSIRIDSGFTGEPEPAIDSSRPEVIDLALDQIGTEHGLAPRVAIRARRD
jgi:hypothetical protein